MEILLLLWAVPIIVVTVVVANRGRSFHYLWWPACLGVIGAIIAIVILVSKAEVERLPSAAQPTAGPAAIAAALRSHRNGQHDRRPDRICSLCCPGGS